MHRAHRAGLAGGAKQRVPTEMAAARKAAHPPLVLRLCGTVLPGSLRCTTSNPGNSGVLSMALRVGGMLCT